MNVYKNRFNSVTNINIRSKLSLIINFDLKKIRLKETNMYPEIKTDCYFIKKIIRLKKILHIFQVANY